jgi:hypothetical protein
MEEKTDLMRILSYDTLRASPPCFHTAKAPYDEWALTGGT